MLIRFFAAARAATGTPELVVPDDLPTLGAALDHVGSAVEIADHARWTALRARCSYLLDGLSTRDLAEPLAGVATVDVMPPFAGG